MALKADSRFLGDPPYTLGQFLAKWLALLEPIMNEEDRQDFLVDLEACTAPFANIGSRRLTEGIDVAEKGDEATPDELMDALLGLQSLDDMGDSANTQIAGMISDLQTRLAAKRAASKQK